MKKLILLIKEAFPFLWAELYSINDLDLSSGFPVIDEDITEISFFMYTDILTTEELDLLRNNWPIGKN